MSLMSKQLQQKTPLIGIQQHLAGEKKAILYGQKGSSGAGWSPGALGAAMLTRKQNGSWKSWGEKAASRALGPSLQVGAGRQSRRGGEGGIRGGGEQSWAPHAGAAAAGTT